MQSTFFKLVRAGLKVILVIGIGVLVFLARLLYRAPI